MMKTKIFFGLLGLSVLAILLFTGCAHREIVTHCLQGHTYGFWGGLWHGLISPFDLVGMLIYDDVTVFAQNNNGAWYAFGFLLGGGGWGLLGGNRFRSR